MWYFTWILGLGFAVLLTIAVALWHELAVAEPGEPGGPPPP